MEKISIHIKWSKYYSNSNEVYLKLKTTMLLDYFKYHKADDFYYVVLNIFLYFFLMKYWIF